MKLKTQFQLLVISLCLIASHVFAEGEDKKDAENKKNTDEEPTLYLESTFVGDKEQPTVSYFIPWKSTGTPDKLHWNIEQKHDKSLEVVDRDIMVRTMMIYNELDMEGSAEE